ncbi:motility associated factor glycosyltransferase family protein [Clostridium tagluense]|uniref:motility associated factor glycosyltransferase family protein n=1 Tax=Clostridium tagluense TaxID=360422 RepID=UPI001CF3DBCA|nr:6-hydroxymethylpterin diphosphokinase MptE-like protein [Clostridium tagluense]MCB2297190.1 DUF115 domain-containing protein [Clostridium tagluense]
MDVYSKNIEFFKVDSYVTKKMKQQDFYNDVKLEPCDGEFNFIMENENGRCFVNSNYDVEREMEELFKNVETDTTFLVIFGFGCGYILDYIDKHYGDTLMEIFIVEPSLKLFKEVLKYKYIPDSLKKFKGDFYILLDEDKQSAANSIFQKIIGKNDPKIVMAYSVPYRTIFKGYFEYMKESIINKIRVERANYNMVSITNKIWIVNCIKSLIVKAVPIEYLIDNLQGYPVIIVAAGPSLNKNIHLLHEVKNRAIIVSIGSASKILHSHSIIPHLRIAIDPFENNDEIYNNIDTSVCPIIYDSFFYYKSLATYKGPKFRMVLDSNRMVQYLFDNAKTKYSMIRSGFSLIIPTLDLFTKLKGSQIIFMGQDLSYPMKKRYAEGSWTDEEVDFEDDRVELVKSVDIYGNEIDTETSFLDVKYMMETIIALNPEIQYINATEGGLNIEGTIIKDFKDVLGEYLIKNLNIRDKVNNVHSEFLQNKYDGYWKTIAESIDILEKDVDDIIRINDSIYTKIRNIYNSTNRAPYKLLKDIKKIDSLYKELEKNKLFSTLCTFDLHPYLRAIEKKYGYNGEDKNKKLESQKNIILNKCVELNEYFSFLKDMLLENKVEL